MIGRSAEESQPVANQFEILSPDVLSGIQRLRLPVENMAAGLQQDDVPAGLR